MNARAIAVLALAAPAAAAPITYQGRLVDAGQPADGTYDMVFTLADQPAGGLALQAVALDDVAVADGVFTVELDFDDMWFDGSDRWLAITVEGTILSPRTRMTHAPYAVRSRVADDLKTPWFKDVTTRVLDVRSAFDTAAVVVTGSGPASIDATNESTGATAKLTTRDNTAVEGVATGIINDGTGVVGRGQHTGVAGVAETTTIPNAGGSLTRIGVSGAAFSSAGSRPVAMYGVYGIASNPPGSFLIVRDAYGLYGEAIRGGDSFSRAYGVYGTTSGVPQGVAFAGYFDGDVHVAGTLTKSNGAFKIDHPVDPENRYLTHSFVEAPEMLNVYSGTTDLDADGRSTVRLPAYFHALNGDPRYQLTAIGAAMPNLHVATEIADGSFTIAGGAPGARVSWQVSAVRLDPGARHRPLVVEQDKAPHHRGLYLDPAAYGFGRDRAIHPGARHEDLD